jgi:hypothetical protein
MRRVAWLAVLLAVAATGTVASPAAAAPPYTSEERSLAIASPSLVYLETVYTGYLRNKTTNVPLLAEPVTYNRRCSGFVVNPDGVVVSTRVCVQPPDETIRQQALYVAGYVLIGEKKLDPGQLRAFVDSNLANSVFTGMAEDTPPAAQLFGQLNVATGAVTDKPAVAGRVLGASDPDQGNVAVVKLNQNNLPAVELDTKSSLDVGVSVLTLGFNTTDADERVGTYTPQSRSVQVTGQGARGKAPFYKINEKLGTYSHGGLALDKDGRAIGMIDEDPGLPNNENRAIAKASAIPPLLTKLGVSNTLDANDKVYRSGLDAYFKGRYSAAINQLDQTTRNVPANHVARTYRELAADREKIEGEPSGLPTWVLPVATGCGAALLAGILGLLIGRRGRARRRVKPDLRRPAPPSYPPAPAPTYQPDPWYQVSQYQQPVPTQGPDPSPAYPAPAYPEQAYPPVPGQPTPQVSGPPENSPWSTPPAPASPPVSTPPMSTPPVSPPPVSTPPASAPPAPQPQHSGSPWVPEPQTHQLPPQQPWAPPPQAPAVWPSAPHVAPEPPPWPPDRTAQEQPPSTSN